MEIQREQGAPISLQKSEGDREIVLSLRIPETSPCILHWGLSRKRTGTWKQPPKSVWPAGTEAADDSAVRSPFALRDDHRAIDVRFQRESLENRYLQFALYFPDNDAWDNNRGRNYVVELTRPEPSEGAAEIIERIIEAEKGNHSWTLMHRYNLCHELLDEVRGHSEGMAALFVWLRFSALRQLDWQRRYNTKPSELAHAQDRLGRKLAEIFAEHPEHREPVRMMLGSMGRGGEGQAIRDEILHIMHRHKIKEVTGHFMEEWHQKLHNNTTPDDVVICRAYLEFLRSDGSRDRFYETLEANGVTRERLAGFERPITTPPDFVPHLKDGLIRDFEHFLHLLRSIHSGTDLDSALDRARHLFDGSLNEHFDFVRHHRHAGDDLPAAEFIDRLTRIRERLADVLRNNGDIDRVRDALYLDIALEETLRRAIEQSLRPDLPEDAVLSLIGGVLDNLCLSQDLPLLHACSREWRVCIETGDLSPDGALKLLAVLDRLRRAVAGYIDAHYRLLQPLAEKLGEAFAAESWTVRLFSEAVVRGRPAFALSALIRHLDPLLRSKAGLGGWQVISRGETRGRFLRIDALGDVQGTRYDEPTILLAEKVRGDEEPPSGATAIITPDSVDLVSHVAVRARNAPVLFVTCYDTATLDELRNLENRRIRLRVEASGDVSYEPDETDAAIPRKNGPGRKAPKKIAGKLAKPRLSHEPIAMDAFRPGCVGGKSLHLKELAGKLPAWIEVPESVALPFGTLEHVVESPENRSVRKELDTLLKHLDADPADTLPQLRNSIAKLEAPDGLLGQLEQVVKRTGLKDAFDRSAAWKCIRGVWASKWNERAYYSRRTRTIEENAMYMAVLVQKVVPADYAFVIHTVNPFSGDAGELYAEVAVGLGETIVGNYPGSALRFVAAKQNPKPKLLAYPGKDVGLFGGGLIYRSDSNAEDLSGYAGAGLYDSLIHPPATEKTLDYSQEPLVHDRKFRDDLLAKITDLGIAVEKAFGAPQDIEGAFAGGAYYVVQSRPQVEADKPSSA